jgi:hypothetical protein
LFVTGAHAATAGIANNANNVRKAIEIIGFCMAALRDFPENGTGRMPGR